MDTNELIKAAPEIAKGAGSLAAAIPFTAVVKRMLGPAADELAEMWRDQVRLYRYERQLKCVEKAERMAQEAGFTPQAVPPKILFPLLEGASFEDNENLHSMWAALLANAASLETTDAVRPGFIAILRQMSVDEAAMMNWMYDATPYGHINRSRIVERYAEMGFALATTENEGPQTNLERLGTCLGGLEASQLISTRTTTVPNLGTLVDYALTSRGREFIRACRAPKPKS
jgi:hypothetical protein